MRTRGVGPQPNDLMLVSDYPGKDEARIGLPLVGKMGQETMRHLEVNGLPDRDEWRLENLIREFRPDGEYPTSDIERDVPELLESLNRTSPKVVVTLGRESARWFLGDIALDEVHSIPWYTENGPVVFPIYNPAAGFRNPEMQAKVSSGFNQLSLFLAGKIRARRLFDDAYAGKENYVEIQSASEVVLYDGLPVSIDSEGWARRPWSVQYSQRPGEGFLIHAGDSESLAKFESEIRSKHLRIIYHSALHDLSVLRAVGFEASDLPFDDTQVMAYLLQLEPLGLKPLCVRHAGMHMQDYDDILGEAGDMLARDYMVSLYDIEQAEYEIRQHEEFQQINSTPLITKDGHIRTDKAGNTVFRRTKKLPTVSKSQLHAAAIRILRSRTPRKLWFDQVDDVQVAGYNRLGTMDEPTLDHAPKPAAIFYANRDSDGTGRLAPELGSRVDALGLREVYNLEIGTYPLIDRMGAVGLRPDLEHFASLSGELGGEIDRQREELVALTGRELFNANSGDQVATHLFDELGLPGFKRTKDGKLSTNDKILEGLEREFGTRFPVVPLIRSYRETYKLKNTFVDRIPDFVTRWPMDGRIHSTFRTTRVVTGRLAASEPNILAMPKHGKFAPKFREGFVEDEGWVLASWDQSQIELRILAHLSQDPYMLAVFRGEIKDKNGNPVDLHSVMGERLFGVAPHLQDESLHRLPSKAVNFGLPMGMTKYGLAIELRKNGLQVDEDDAQRWIEQADELYKGVPLYKERMIEEAKRNGYIRCMSGRIRYIGGIKSWDEFVREEAQRFAFSTPIQEGAQTVMKTAEYHVWNDIVVPWNNTRGHSVDPLVQIHDDLLMRVREPLAQELNVAMTWAMTQTFKGLTVPLATDGVWGYNWAKKKFNERGMRKF